MTDPYAGSPRLTDEQQAVVALSADTKALITAGAGAGKTHTLVRRLDALVASGELGVGEILVLSFSRTAVRELKERLVLYGDAARNVRVQTFDSWALELLVDTHADAGWQERPFDERIKAAIKAIEEEENDDFFADLRHVIIDEVQDLVGDRRELVEVLLDVFGHDIGFTMVGDPAQAIYTWQVEDPETRRGEAGRFFDWLDHTFGDDLKRIDLTQNFRAETDEARQALKYGPVLQKSFDGGKLYRDLRTVLFGCMDFGQLDDEYVQASLREFDGTTAILCRTNGQALLISERLQLGGVPHRLQRAVRDRVAPAWIGTLLRSCVGSQLIKSRFEEIIPELALPPKTDVDQIWRLLVRAGRSKGDTVNLDRVRVLLAERRLPDELTAQPSAALTVSSVHRAKGLEFDRVLILDPGPLRPDIDDAAEEARMLYVALTRARSELMRLEFELPKPYYIKQDRWKRWGRYSFARGAYWRRGGFEVSSSDVYHEAPAGTADGKAAAVQNYLATEVLAGDSVLLERITEAPNVIGQSPDYRVLHAGREIGTVSETFRKALHSHMNKNRGNTEKGWPKTLSSVRIDAVETVAGSEAVGMRAGLGERGVWLVPRLVGLSRFTYDKSEPQEEEADE